MDNDYIYDVYGGIPICDNYLEAAIGQILPPFLFPVTKTGTSNTGPSTSPGIVISEDEKTPAKTGVNCLKCNIYNEYAEANQKDGKYICYDCRNR